MDPEGALGYPGILLTHFSEYLRTNSVLPPLTHILRWLVLEVLGLETTDRIRGFAILVLALDCFAVVIIFKTMLKLEVNRYLSFLLALSFSIGISSFEFWAFAGHQDHFTPFFVSVFSYFLVSFYLKPSNGSALGLGLASALLIHQLPTATYALPIALINLALIQYLKRLSVLAKHGIVFSCMAIAVGILIFRNYNYSGSLASSPKGGPIIMMFVQETMGWHTPEKVERIRNLIKEAQAPTWYLWCFDNFKNPTNPPNTGWDYLARCFGMCMPITKVERQANLPWPFDFSEVISKLDELGAASEARLVELDQQDVLHRQYLYKGSSWEFTPRWSTIHGAESLKIAKYFLIHYPKQYLEGIQHHHRIFSHGGPYFLTRILFNEFIGGSAIQYIQKDHPGFAKFIYKFNQYYFSPMLFYFYFALPVFLILFFFIRNTVSTSLVELWIFATPIYTMALLYSSTVSQENDRYFYHTIPFLIIALGLLLKDGAKWFSLVKQRISK